MRRIVLILGIVLALVLSGSFITRPALAEKPSWAGDKGAEKKGKQGHGNSKKNKKHGQGVSAEGSPPGMKGGNYFSEETRITVHKYYGEQFRSGRCPPGLAKKGNGCLPPGQAKKWAIGRPLPRDVIYHDLPPEVLVQLGPIPSRHRFVRVASDILMIAVGTGMVIDAIEDIGRAF
ncbi:MAG: hypothetical protein C4576_19230 [Desulfobacteraceae bacterium]|nr:MAG: hypothetical protein C4576_19230 [Desulfobacteraceae bacterium]